MTILKNKNLLFVAFFLILAVFLLTGFLGLGTDFLYDWDEGIYAQVSRETGFSLAPYWNDQPWFEKPPLVFWLTKLSFSLFGENEFGARFFMPILGAVSLTFLYFLVKERLGNKTALLTVVFFFLAPLFLARSRGLNTDGALLTGVIASLYFLTKLEKKLTNKEKICFWDYFYSALAMSLAVLAKGLMGFLPGLIWLFYLFIARKSFLFGTLKAWLTVALLTIILILPWHIYQSVRFGNDFWQVYFIEHIVRRANQPIEYHFGGKLYYIKFLISEFSYWLILPILGGFFWLFNQAKEKKVDDNFIFFSVWGGLVLGLFTFSKTKLFWYILPLYPVLAVLWGYGWRKLLSFGKNLFLIPIVFIFALSLVSGHRAIVNREEPKPSAKIALAQEARQSCPKPLLFLVDKNERAAANILPDELTLSSSFSYGGSPAVVFYYGGPVSFFYQINQFENRLSKKSASVCAMITQEDYQDFNLGHKIVNQQQEWLLIK